MPLHHAVLALLADGPSHGYELRGAFEQAVGPDWGGLNIGHLYQLLDRLARDGLVVADRQPQTSKPDRLVYRLTPDGVAELNRWLNQPAQRTRGYRDDFFLKLLAARAVGDAQLVAGIVSRQRGHLLRTLRAIGGQPAASHDLVASLITTSAELHTRAALALLDVVEQHVESLAAARPVRPNIEAETAGEDAAGPAAVGSL